MKLNDLIPNRIHNILKLLQPICFRYKSVKTCRFYSHILGCVALLYDFKSNICYYKFLNKSGGGSHSHLKLSLILLRGVIYYYLSVSHLHGPVSSSTYILLPLILQN